MIDSQSAVQNAVVAALKAATAVTSLASVWQNPPENTQPPAVIVGLVSLQASDDKDGNFDQATIEVHTYVRQPDARQLYALNTAVRNALEGQTITATGATISRVVFLSASPDIQADGLTYQDRLTFEMWVQP